ncbi:hypothetical protein ACROYT_G026727 [Oculina patagonica]
MKILAVAILVFCTFICAAFSFKCYQCPTTAIPDGKAYSTDQCEKDQKTMDCPANNTCFKSHGTTTDDIEREARGCMLKQECEVLKNLCEKGTDEQKKALKIKECVAACCVSDGDTPCNSGFTVSINMMMIMFAVLCSLKLF